MPRQKNYKYKKIKWGGFLKKILAGFLCFGFVLSLFVVGAFLYIIKDLPDSSKMDNKKALESTKIYDRTGTILLYEIHGEEKRTVISSGQISQHLKDATIVAEDFNFYKHNGIDYRSIIRALLVDIYKGKLSQGGSTITQQLVKNFFFNTEKTFTRKIKEAVLAIEIERRYSKEEILTLYLNQIPYGSNAYGIEAAAQTFFNKSASEITLNEAALLAALPKAPSYYSPYGQNKEDMIYRKNSILSKMREVGFINEEGFVKAKNDPLVFAKQRENIKAPHFVMYVKDYLENIYGVNLIENGGLRVKTTLDYDLQKKAEEIISKYGIINEKKYKAGNAALVSVDPKTGQLIAMVGSRDYFDVAKDGNFNVTTSKNRQPGSSFKPFAYAEFFKKGYTTDTVLFDVKTEFSTNPDESYSPDNYDDKFRGPIQVKSALAQSLNIPAVKVLYLAGIDDTISLAHDMGITTLQDRSRLGLSLVLGGGEVRPIDMANAYSVFADNGIKNSESFVLEIKNSKGEIMEKWEQKQKQIIPQNIARTISSILSDNNLRAPVFGEHNDLWFDGRPVAAKTGTTQKYRDAWVVGYTPSISTAIWVGNNNGSPMERGGAGIAAAGPIFHEFMEYFLNKNQIEEFIKPDAISSEKPILNGNYISEIKVKIDRDSGKLITDQTPPQKIEEKSFKEIHTILNYIDKNNPSGDSPEHPKQDPQYNNWESAIQKWVENNKTIPISKEEKIPTEYDDIHTEVNKPKISIIYPPDNYSVSDKLSVKTKIEGQYPVKEVDFYINNNLTYSDFNPPYNADIDLNNIDKNGMLLSVRAYDKYDNIGEASVTLIK